MANEDSVLVPPDLMRLYEEVRKDVAKLARGSIEILSEPDGAQAYVDGRFVGVTPTAVEGLTIGRHFLTCKKEGYAKGVQKVVVSAHRQQSVTARLRRSEKYLLLAQSIERSGQAFGREVASDAMIELRSFLFIDQVVFVRLSQHGSDAAIDAAVYDLRSQRRLSQVKRSLRPEQAESAGEEVARTLFLNVAYDGSLPAPPPERPPPSAHQRPLTAQWWFWTAIGVATAAAIVIPLEAVPDDRSTPGFRPAVITWH
jgi:hypothetical protein